METGKVWNEYDPWHQPKKLVHGSQNSNIKIEEHDFCEKELVIVTVDIYL